MGDLGSGSCSLPVSLLASKPFFSFFFSFFALMHRLTCWTTARRRLLENREEESRGSLDNLFWKTGHRRVCVRKCVYTVDMLIELSEHTNFVSRSDFYPTKLGYLRESERCSDFESNNYYC